MHCEIGGTRGPLGYVSALGATRLVHWLILVAPSCLRSHNARYIMLKSLRNAHYLTEIIWRHGTWFSLDKGLFNQEIAANLSSVRIGKNLMLVRRWIAHEDTMQITMILLVIIDNWLLIALGTLQGRHDERDGVPNHQPHDCLPKSLFRRRSKKASKLLVTGSCVGNSPVTGEFPAQRASNAENGSIWWRHHESWLFADLSKFLNFVRATFPYYKHYKFQLSIRNRLIMKYL